MSNCQRCGRRKSNHDVAWCRQCRGWLQWLAIQRTRGHELM